MIDALLSTSAALTAAIYFGNWFAGDSASNPWLAVWSALFSIYAYRVHRMKRRLSQQHMGELLQALREKSAERSYASQSYPDH
jgi:ABC-type enterobactin transport system permease subunit